MSSMTTTGVKKTRFNLDLKTIGPFVALIILFLIGILVNQAFLSTGNLTNILTRSSFIGIIAVGGYFCHNRWRYRSFRGVNGGVYFRLHDCHYEYTGGHYGAGHYDRASGCFGLGIIGKCSRICKRLSDDKREDRSLHCHPWYDGDLPILGHLCGGWGHVGP